MAARRTSEDDEDERVPSPEANNDLVGAQSAEQELLAALRGGRMHHGWLISGPKGVGKATLAFRLARFLLRFGKDPSAIARATSLAVAPDDPIARQVASGAAQDLLVIRRPRDEKTGAEKSVIPVDEVRRLQPFFGVAAGAGGWRIAIIDSVDELNRNAANAVLKSLEEPPNRALLLLISHTPGAVLPTIRSRCRPLHMSPMPASELAPKLADLGSRLGLPGLSSSDAAQLVELAKGCVGRAIELWVHDGLSLARAIDATLDALPDISARKAAALLDGAKRDYDLTADLVVGALRRVALDAARETKNGAEFARLAQFAPAHVWAELAGDLESFLARGAAINMDERMMMGEALRRIAGTVARA
jgi:DNA polymerase III subunit delta'